MRLRKRVAKFLGWCLLVCVTSLTGGLWFAYWYITDSETVAKFIREHGVRYFPGAFLDPGRVCPASFQASRCCMISGCGS